MRSNRYIWPIVLLLLMAGCSPKIVPFSTDNLTNRSFYRQMPDIVEKQVHIDSVAIYECIFAQKLYEGFYVIDYSEVNSRNESNILKYKDFKGHYQKLYLLKLITQPVDSIFIYFSLKYNEFDQCIGFGPGYCGWLNKHKKSIFFNTEIYTHSFKNDFYLKQNNLPLALYLNADTIDQNKMINIEKMIVEKSVEAGNNVVIDIHRIFNDPGALKFEYFGTKKIY
jgi:hypothetical protein